MKITKLNISEKKADELGLEEFHSERFGHILALVGKNGSGKSRYLRVIESIIVNSDFRNVLQDSFTGLPKNLIQNARQLSNYVEPYNLNQQLTELQDKIKKNPKSKEVATELQRVQSKIIQLNRNRQFQLSTQALQRINDINALIKREVTKRVKVIKPSDFRALKSSIEKTIKGGTTFQNIIDSTQENIEINELQMINESALNYLQRLPHKLSYDDIDTRGDERKFKNRVAYKRYKLLKDLIHEFLGKSLEWHSRSSNVDEEDDHILIKATGYWTLNKREFDYSEFSEGEKVLFTYAILLFLLNTNSKVKFSESIIIIDEPELNLHPKAQIKLIQSIEQLIKEQGQLIIATHSLSIVSNLDYGSIFLVRNNRLNAPSSSVPFSSVDDLMGFDRHYNKIVEFLVSTPSWAMTNFMAQCFEDPEIFEFASEKDPQIELFKSLLIGSNNLNLLDFGSGKGRLLERIKENKASWSRIKNYDCFDIDSRHNDLIKTKGANTVFNKLDQIPENKYDIAVLVNVLHEINIKDWTSSINKLKKCLKPSGILAIIEDTQLPVGELPNEHGFLILDKNELKKLLGKETAFITPKGERYKDRIICGFIESNNLKRIDKNSLISTLELLKTNSLKAIVEYRELAGKSKELGLGRLYGLKANLYVNSELAIEQLKSKK